MTSRSIGRGVCPRCGREGRVVLKEVSGKLYVYVKHGRKWCYLGPLEKVRLEEVLVDLGGYHLVTTIAEQLGSRILGGRAVKLSSLLTLCAAVITAAYALALGGHEYGCYVLALVAAFAATISLAVARYEMVRRSHAYAVLREKLAKWGFPGYVAVSGAAIAILVLAGLPLQCPLKLTLEVALVSGVTRHFEYPLPAFILAGAALAVLSRPLRSGEHSRWSFIVASSLLGCFYLYAFHLACVLLEYGLAGLSTPLLLFTMLAPLITALPVMLIAACLAVFMDLLVGLEEVT